MSVGRSVCRSVCLPVCLPACHWNGATLRTWSSSFSATNPHHYTLARHWFFVFFFFSFLSFCFLFVCFVLTNGLSLSGGVSTNVSKQAFLVCFLFFWGCLFVSLFFAGTVSKTKPRNFDCALATLATAVQKLCVCHPVGRHHACFCIGPQGESFQTGHQRTTTYRHEWTRKPAAPESKAKIPGAVWLSVRRQTTDVDIPLKLLVCFRNKRRQFTDRRARSYLGCSLLNLLVSVGYGRHVRFDCIEANVHFTLVHCWTRRTKRSRLKLAGQDKSRFLSEEQRLKKEEKRKQKRDTIVSQTVNFTDYSHTRAATFKDCPFSSRFVLLLSYRAVLLLSSLQPWLQ